MRSSEKFSFWSKQKVVVKIPKCKKVKRRRRRGRRNRQYITKNTALVSFLALQNTFSFDCVVKLPSWFFDSVHFVCYLAPSILSVFFSFAPFIFYWKCSQVLDFFYLILIHFERSVFLFQWMFCYSYFPLFWSLQGIEFGPSLFALTLNIFLRLLYVSLIKYDAILFPVCRFTFLESFHLRHLSFVYRLVVCLKTKGLTPANCLKLMNFHSCLWINCDMELVSTVLQPCSSAHCLKLR